MKCPEFGNEMAQVDIRLGQAVLRWVDHESWFGLGGESIAEGLQREHTYQLIDVRNTGKSLLVIKYRTSRHPF
jgi:hypothetical protein